MLPRTAIRERKDQPIVDRSPLQDCCWEKYQIFWQHHICNCRDSVHKNSRPSLMALCAHGAGCCCSPNSPSPSPPPPSRLPKRKKKTKQHAIHATTIIITIITNIIRLGHTQSQIWHRTNCAADYMFLSAPSAAATNLTQATLYAGWKTPRQIFSIRAHFGGAIQPPSLSLPACFPPITIPPAPLQPVASTSTLFC